MNCTECHKQRPLKAVFCDECGEQMCSYGGKNICHIDEMEAIEHNGITKKVCFNCSIKLKVRD